MNVYFSGIGGAALGPLSHLALDCGYRVFGSDLAQTMFTKQLDPTVEFQIGPQDGHYLESINQQYGLDWIIYTSALPADHPELVRAQALGIRTSKRDQFISHILSEKQQKLIAVSGTHGKTTTTAMIVWIANYLSLPLSYQLGTNIPWGPSSRFDQNARYFAYEADEYDRNMLSFHPDIAVIPSLDWDHPDIYPTRSDYQQAFQQFIDQSQVTITTPQVISDNHLNSDTVMLSDSEQNHNISLAGQHNRTNAQLAALAAETAQLCSFEQALDAVSHFPGTQRRFERLSDNIYTDYAHHPTEIASTIQMATEINPKVVVIYQPHQDKRQRQISALYKHAFDLADHVYWLPTYEPAGRSNSTNLSPDDLIQTLANPSLASVAMMDNSLLSTIKDHQSSGDLVLALSAGDLDEWLRANL